MMGFSEDRLKGYFITFEGVEGSGKSTQIGLLADSLGKKGRPVVRTREPGGTKLGDGIRSLLLDSKNLEIDSKTELFLYLASRAQHLKEVILPALAQGKVVLCDRFTDATLVYQGDGRGLPEREVAQIAHFASGGLQPDLTLLLDIDVKKGLSRLKGRDEINRLDQETVDFHQAVRAGYLRLAERARRIRVISADASREEISAKIMEEVDALLS